MLPNFFVIGAYKSGTTSLFRYLSQHPQIFVPTVKEPSYFAFGAAGLTGNSPVFRKSIKTLTEYEALYQGASGYVAIGDVSPEYMTSPVAAGLIRQVVPDAKLIAILRNPVERAFSDFLMYRRDGLEELADFSAALKEQAARASRKDPTGSYVSTGFYGEQLARYYELFPPGQILVLFLEELESDAPGTLARIFAFLGVDATFTPRNLAVYNRSGVASNPLVKHLFRHRRIVAPVARLLVPRRLRDQLRSRLEAGLDRPSLPSPARRFLIEAYRSDVQLLERLTGKSCRHWLE